jgi:hypothetical protein
MNAKKKSPVRGRTDNVKVDPVKDYKQHIMKPDLKKLESKLKLFGFSRVEEIPEMPLICRLKKQGPVILHPKHTFDPHIGEISEFIRPITCDSIFKLKALVGVPNEVAARERKLQTGTLMRKVQIQHLPVESKFRFTALDAPARIALTDMAHNLLHGYVEEDRIGRQPYKAVVDYMLGRARELPTFTAKELIVCPGETVYFSGFAAMFFLNVIVYGDGQIKMANNSKLHAYHIRHVPV